jgi:hypothetical protein
MVGWDVYDRQYYTLNCAKPILVSWYFIRSILFNITYYSACHNYNDKKYFNTGGFQYFFSGDA